MATTNRVYCWKDGERLLVDLNGATIEAKSLTFDQHIVTLQFQARLTVMKSPGVAWNKAPMPTRAKSPTNADPLLDECLW